MTTIRDNIDQRTNSQPGIEASQGVVNDGTSDPTGQFPRQEYFNSSNINYAARGSSRNELYVGGGDDGVPLHLSIPPPSEYPYNQVQETVSGHVIEIDDTAGAERILIKHRTGSGVELRHDGTVVVSSVLNKIEVSGADHTVIVEGEGNLVYKGNLNLKVDGDLNIDCLNYNVNVRGNRNENVKGSDRKTVGGNAGQIIKGGYSTTVTQQVTDTFLAGHSHNVKGTFSNNIDGSANYVSSGEAAFTSEVRINMSTEDLNIAGTSTSVFGVTGTFGGAGVVFYGQGGTFSEGITAPTFHGDLDGVAQTSRVTRSQTYSEASQGNAGTPITNTATPSTALPNGSNITDYLGKAAGGIRKVKIDVGNYIKNFIDKSEAYGGISDTPLTTKSARSRLKDPANRGKSAAVSSMISERVVSPTVVQVAPSGIGRVISGDSTPKFGRTVFGNTGGVTPANAFLPKRGLRTVLPDPLYNPDFATTIDGKLKLAPGVTLSRFFGSTGDSTSLDFIKTQEERHNIARHLYLHAEVIRSIQTNKTDFADFRLVVAEGVYKPGPSETAGGINDLKLKGRAVVYELFNLQGQLDLFNTFNVAEYWKDTLNYERMILHYDTYNPNQTLHAQIVLIMPQLSDDWSGNFTRSVETQFNGNVLSQGELVEVLSASSPSPTASTGQPIVAASDNQYYSWAAGVDRRVSPALLAKLEAISKQFGRPLVITSGYRDPQRNERVGGASGSQHLTGLAVDVSTGGLSQQQVLQLLEIASRNGIVGIGVYTNGSVHFDIRPNSGNVAWGPDYTRNSISQVAWAGKTLQNHTNGTIV